MDLLQYRTEQGLSLEQTAVALGLAASSKGWLSEIENGKKDASVRLAIRIERWTGGAVPAASVCRELAVDHVPGPPVESEVVPEKALPVTLAKSGAVQ